MGKKIREEDLLHKIYLNDSCPLVFVCFVSLNVCIYGLVNSPCEQRQGLAVLSSMMIKQYKTELITTMATRKAKMKTMTSALLLELCTCKHC